MDNLKKVIVWKYTTKFSEAGDIFRRLMKVSSTLKLISMKMFNFPQRHATAGRVLNEVTGRKSECPPAKLQGSVEERKEQWNFLDQPPRFPNNNLKYHATWITCYQWKKSFYSNLQFFNYLLNLYNIGLSNHINREQWSKSAITKERYIILFQHKRKSIDAIAGKLHNKVLLNRIQPQINLISNWSQAQFRKSR